MPTVFSHMAVPLAASLGLGRHTVPRRLMVAGMVGSMLPDIDVVGFQLGIEYASDYGHRGFSHSLLFAAALALIGMAASRYFQASAKTIFFFLFVSIASHGMLDCFTNGGRGVALLWPFSSERYFAPFPVIEVSPIGLSRFLSARGWDVLKSEAVWVWLPCLGIGAAIWLMRARCRARAEL